MTRYGREPQKTTRVERGEADMTWEEIGRALGLEGEAGRKTAFMIYKNAMQKIRNRPHSIQALKELVELRNAQRGRRTPLPDWDI